MIDNVGVDNCYVDGEFYLSCVKFLLLMLWKLEMELGFWMDMLF